MRNTIKDKKHISVVDLFAGPGGLGEGFNSFNLKGYRPFRVKLSIEKDEQAWQTLRLRNFFHQFEHGGEPEKYYSFAKGEIDWKVLGKEYPKEINAAENAVRRPFELGKEREAIVFSWIREALRETNNGDWVLIGGPPCQAYSIIGRNRMKKDSARKFDKDERHFLYREYLRIIHKFKPPVFIMENVPGILSSTIKGKKKIFPLILRDLGCPIRATKVRRWGNPIYKIYSLTKRDLFTETLEPKDFVINCDKYSIPQARNRVILYGIREDVNLTPHNLIPYKRSPVNIWDVISDLPPLRSEVSQGRDTAEYWKKILKSIPKMEWYNKLTDESVKTVIRKKLGNLDNGAITSGSNYLPAGRRPERFGNWYRPHRTCKGTFNHQAKSHMESDLLRYFFVACFGEAKGLSPTLKYFPPELLPNHKNVKKALKSKNAEFSDRFKVQLKKNPARTITSHISKDGHYFIHPDPCQCRSLTVREAARIQTFQDNYIFMGNRTSQYTQVGNAVPPLLALQIAEVVYRTLQEE